MRGEALLALARLEVDHAADAEVRVDQPRVDVEQRAEFLREAMEHAEVMRLLPVEPAGGERRCHRLVDVLQHGRRPRGQVVVEEHHAGIEIGEADAPARAHDRLQREAAPRGERNGRGLGESRDQRAKTHAHARLREDVAQRVDVLQIERVARVILGDEQHAARVGAHALDRGLDRLHAQRQEGGIQIVEAAREKVRVDRGELEAGVAEIDGRIERHRVLLPLRAQPPLDVRHPVEKALLELEQRSGKRGGEMGNHGERGVPKGSDCSREPSPKKTGRLCGRPE